MAYAKVTIEMEGLDPIVLEFDDIQFTMKSKILKR